MKRMLMLGVTAVCMVALNGCPLPGTSVVGEWSVEYSVPGGTIIEIWTFFEDGTFTWEDEEGNSGEGVFSQVGSTVTATESFTDGGAAIEVETTVNVSRNGNTFRGRLVQTVNGETDLNVVVNGTRL